MKVMELNEENFDEKVLKTDKKVLVDFYAEWCGPCKMMSPVIDTVSDNLDDYYVYKVNVDQCPNISRRYGVMSIPNLIVFKNGDIIKNDLGFKTEDELREFLKD